MMAVIHVGNNGAALVGQPGNPLKERDGAGQWTLTYRYWCSDTAAESLLPAHGAACTESGHTSLVCTRVGIAPKPGAPGRVDVTVVYSPLDAGKIVPHKSGDIVKEAAFTWRELPIDDPVLLQTYTTAAIETAKANGALAKPVAVTEYTYSEYLESFTWTEASITTGLDATAAPTGLTGATAANWKLVGCTVRQTGDLMEKRLVWHYSKGGWGITA